MMGDKDRFTRTLISALLVIPILWMVGCEGGATPAPAETVIVEEAAPEDELPPDLDPAEGWQPYAEEVAPVGDAELAPGYEPMRDGAAAMDEGLKEMLLESGLKINTARTVVLPETASSSMVQNLDLAADSRVVELEDMRDIDCMFRQDCERHDYSMRESVTILLEGTSGEGVALSSWATTPGEPGTAAEGLYGYWYHIDANLFGDPEVHCVNSFSIDFGPVTPLDYDGNGTPDFGSSYLFFNWLSPAVEQKENTLTFDYDPPICARKSLDELKPSPFSFSIASAYPPRVVEGQVQDLNGTTYWVESIVPDYPPSEALSSSQPAGPGAGEVPPGLVEVNDADIHCLFVQDCSHKWNSQLDSFTLEGTEGYGFLETLKRPAGEPGTAAEGLYGYEYIFDLRSGLIGAPGVHCVHSFSIDFGPVTSVDYDQNGTLDFGYVYIPGGEVSRVRPAAVEQEHNTVTFLFDPALCAGRPVFDAEDGEHGDVSARFGLASAYPPRSVDWQIQDIQGATYSGEHETAGAPDYPQQQTIEETVSIAPIAAAEDPNAFDQAKLEEMFRTEGVVLGILVLETNAPDSLLPSGAYLERAYLDGDQGVVELIDVTSGETVYKVDLLAQRVEDPSLIIPTASIFLGSKTCLTCLWDWYICRDCFFWEEGMTPERCLEILESLTP